MHEFLDGLPFLTLGHLSEPFCRRVNVAHFGLPQQQPQTLTNVRIPSGIVDLSNSAPLFLITAAIGACRSLHGRDSKHLPGAGDIKTHSPEATKAAKKSLSSLHDDETGKDSSSQCISWMELVTYSRVGSRQS